MPREYLYFETNELELELELSLILNTETKHKITNWKRKGSSLTS
jgi:hypothetical protein